MIASVAKVARCKDHYKMNWAPKFPPRFPPTHETLTPLVVSIIIGPFDVREENTSKGNKEPIVNEILETNIEIPNSDNKVTKELSWTTRPRLKATAPLDKIMLQDVAIIKCTRSLLQIMLQ
jgi:hypothetical protein